MRLNPFVVYKELAVPLFSWLHSWQYNSSKCLCVYAFSLCICEFEPRSPCAVRVVAIIKEKKI